MERNFFIHKIKQSFSVHPIVALLGPRQCGKTTLARMLAQDRSDVTFFDLENPEDLLRLENPKLALTGLSGLIIIDEIQLRPDLFPILRVMVDDPTCVQQFLILGSASRDLIRQSSETLAGRIAHIELTPFDYQETHNMIQLWERGGFPRSYLADSLEHSEEWRKNYIKTFLERDIPALGIRIAPLQLRRFWMMLAHYHGNLFNASELARSMGVKSLSIAHYVDILTGVFMVRQLIPWHVNIKKRQVKACKIYIRDSGLLHTLLGQESLHRLQGHPKLGASWEGFALEEIIRHHRAEPEDCYFWATYGGAELDLLICIKGKILGFEFKYGDAPKLTKSMKIACETLELDSLTVIYPGDKCFALSENVTLSGLGKYLATSYLFEN